ncbi:FAD-dependent monooxygenase [Geomonas sp.]|uniref:FAD-dependent monooxygenase n=1 Tax=Geomonas sp. TaxID=2651584 RepID=UPI002B49BC7F|nr:FAD-dependent monooxygenase [Geomonas sp.]HJV35839.1 FAD-dependent monooxygenase [Geomonas sp.]
MSTERVPLIIGAGPVGLAAALFLARQGQRVRIVEMLDRDNGLRQPVDRQVVRRVELLTSMVAGQSTFTRAVRDLAFPAAVKTPVLHTRILKAVTGLDHPLST